MNGFLKSHSIINEYPINYNIFPFSKKVKFYEIELNAGEFLVIPKLWLHWIESEADTVAFSFLISEITYYFDCNIINSISKNSIFYKGKHIIDFHLDKFLDNNIDNFYNLYLSKNKDVSPVYKLNSKIKSRIHNIQLKNVLNIFKKQPNIFAYIGMNEVDKENSFYKIPNFDNINFDNILKYKTFLWMNLKNKINSGLHFDLDHSILFVVHGKKKVLLTNPCNKKFLYITPLNKIDFINQNEL